MITRKIPVNLWNLVSSWSALHQERLDGSGYPFHIQADDLPLGARLMAVADVFTGITEDRSYRKGMTRENALGVLHEMVARGELDGRLVALLESRFDAVNRARAEAQAQAVRGYGEFREALQGGGESG
jgi:HD-GYP domain-containing protein (c-di-GMP phosphodiesterase class II)